MLYVYNICIQLYNTINLLMFNQKDHLGNEKVLKDLWCSVYSLIAPIFAILTLESSENLDSHLNYRVGGVWAYWTNSLVKTFFAV